MSGDLIFVPRLHLVRHHCSAQYQTARVARCLGLHIEGIDIAVGCNGLSPPRLIRSNLETEWKHESSPSCWHCSLAFNHVSSSFTTFVFLAPLLLHLLPSCGLKPGGRVR